MIRRTKKLQYSDVVEYHIWQNYWISLTLNGKWKLYSVKKYIQYKSMYLFSSVAQLCLILFDPIVCSTPGLPVYHQLLELLKLTSIKSVMPSNHLILCHPLLFLPSIFPSIRKVSFPVSQFFTSGGQSTTIHI